MPIANYSSIFSISQRVSPDRPNTIHFSHHCFSPIAAIHRGGIKTIVIPEENEKDLVEIPDNIKDQLDIRPVRWIDDVLEIALTEKPTPLEGGENLSEIKKKILAVGNKKEEVRHHQSLLTVRISSWYKFLAHIRL